MKKHLPHTYCAPNMVSVTGGGAGGRGGGAEKADRPPLTALHLSLLKAPQGTKVL